VYLDILPTKDASEEAITATLKNTCATFSNIAEIRLVKKKVV
jgi:hypothetical protein